MDADLPPDTEPLPADTPPELTEEDRVEILLLWAPVRGEA